MKKITLLLILFLIVSNSYSQKWTTYKQVTVGMGLQQLKVSAVAVDSNDIKWFGTSNSILKFDGTNWSTYTHFNTNTTSNQIAGSIVGRIVLDKKGNRWFLTNGGLSKFDGTNWKTFTEADGFSGDGAKNISKDSHGNLWFPIENGLLKYDGTNWKTYSEADGFPINVSTMSEDSYGNLWFVTHDSVSKFDGAKWTNYTDITGVSTIASDSFGNTWVYSSPRRQMLKFDGANWITVDSFYFNQVNNNAIAIDGHNIWLGTRSGAMKFDGLKWTKYTTTDGLIDNNINAIAIEGSNIWFGTDKGLSKFDGTNWTTYTGVAGGNAILAICIDGLNTWLGTNGNGVSRFDGINWISFKASSTIVDNNVQSIAMDSKGNLWVGTFNGLSKFDGKDWKTYTTNDGLLYYNITSIVTEGQDVWIGTMGALFKNYGINWTTYKTREGLVDNQVNCITKDIQGNKWIGTPNGVSKFDGTSWAKYTKYNTAMGLSDNNVQAIAIDSKGNKWFGTPSGIAMFNDTTWTKYTIDNGLIDNNVRSISIDNLGNKWFGTSKGVSMFDGTTWITYTQKDGLISDNVLSITIDSQNNKWFGTTRGISKFDCTHWINYKAPAVTKILIDSLDNKWFATSMGVLKFNNRNWITYKTDIFQINNVSAIGIDKENTKWFGTSNGILKFDGINWALYNYYDGLINNSIHSIAIDSQNNKWFATAGGVSKFDDSLWTNYTANDGLINNDVLAVAIDSLGTKWFGTKVGVSKFDGTRCTNYTTANGLTFKPPIYGQYSYSDEGVATIAVDLLNNKWFGIMGGYHVANSTRACMFNDVSWVSPNTGCVYEQTTQAIAIDSKNNMWMATVGDPMHHRGCGIIKYDSKNFRNYSFIYTGLMNIDFYSIAIDSKNNAWFGSNNGIYKLDNIPSMVALPDTINLFINEDTIANINIFSDVNWSLNCDQNWLTFSKTYGSNNAKITLKATENSFVNIRTAAIKISSQGLDSQIIIVNQQVRPILKLSEHNISMNSLNESCNKIFVESNTTWKATFDQDWLTVNPINGINNDTLTLVALNTNPSSIERKGTVTVSAPRVISQFVTVTQTGDATNISEESNALIDFYPNPVLDFMIIKSSKQFSQASITIYQVNGKIIYSSKMSNDLTKIDMSQFSPGIYVIRIISSKNVSIKRIIKV